MRKTYWKGGRKGDPRGTLGWENRLHTEIKWSGGERTGRTHPIRGRKTYKAKTQGGRENDKGWGS